MKLKSMKNIYTVCYESLCNDPKTWNSIKSLININERQESNFILSHKKIELDYDKCLYDKCTKLYECLKDELLLSLILYQLNNWIVITLKKYSKYIDLVYV